MASYDHDDNHIHVEQDYVDDDDDNEGLHLSLDLQPRALWRPPQGKTAEEELGFMKRLSVASVKA